jgi:hypothetical protein
MLVKQADGTLAWVAKKMRQGASIASKGRLKLYSAKSPKKSARSGTSKNMEASLVSAVRQLESSLARHDFVRARDEEGQFVGGNQASHEDMMLAYQQRQARLKKIAAAGAIGMTGAAAFNPAVRGAVVNAGRKIAGKSGMIGRAVSRGIAARVGR